MNIDTLQLGGIVIISLGLIEIIKLLISTISKYVKGGNGNGMKIDSTQDLQISAHSNFFTHL